jgi:hypothetical protein
MMMHGLECDAVGEPIRFRFGIFALERFGERISTGSSGLGPIPESLKMNEINIEIPIFLDSMLISSTSFFRQTLTPNS